MNTTAREDHSTSSEKSADTRDPASVELPALNPTPHLCRARVKKTALEIAAQTRAKKFTRVGLSFLQRIEARTRAAIAEEVRRHPSIGKTLQ